MCSIGDEVTVLTERLKTLPIYPIYENSSEKESVIALQFMCILDFHANYKMKLYDRIKQHQQPKLLGQLMQFRRFEKFRYYHYAVNKQYGDYVLQCQYCYLVGRCGYILTHMVLNHNVHISLKDCVFCNRETLEAHLGNGSLGQCYSEYVERNEIESDINVGETVTIFYDGLKKLCQKLKIFSTRKKSYAGRGYRCKETLAHDYGGDIAVEYEVRYNILKKHQTSNISKSLDREYRRIMEILYGNGIGSEKEKRLMPSYTISDDSEDEDNEVNNITAENGEINSSETFSEDDMTPEILVKREPEFNYSPLPIPSSYSNPMSSTSRPMGRRISRLTTRSDWTPTNESEEFALNIARKLEKIPQDKRRQLEIDIEMKILQTEREAIGDGCQQ